MKNISDLSVGDWVEFKGEPSRVLECGTIIVSPKTLGFKPRLTLSVKNDIYDCIDIDKVIPIPITAEILEKNGLVRHERDADKPKRVVLSNHFIRAITYTDVDWWRVIIYDEELPSKELFNGIIYSVRQLQHALRLADADKEIQL